MENKKKIGALIVLGGIALLGYSYFKKNKPTVASSQANQLERESDLYKKGIIKDDTVIKGVNLQNATTDRYGGLFSMSEKDLAQVQQNIDINMTKFFGGNAPNQMAQNFQNTDFSTLPDLSKIDWSKVDFSKLK
jgi:predicted negative regulator of RcsB-dependent stress response